MKSRRIKVWVIEKGVAFNLCFPSNNDIYTYAILWYSLVVNSRGRLFIVINDYGNQNKIQFHSKKYNERLVKIMGDA